MERLKRGKGRFESLRRWAALLGLLVLLAGCNDDPQEWFQVRNDSLSQAFVIVATDPGRDIYPIQPQSAVALDNSFNSSGGNVEVLGPTCKLLSKFRAPQTQNTIFDPKTNAWLGVYQITIPAIGGPTVASTNTRPLDASLPTVAGAVLDPTKLDPSVCPPVTVPGATPEG